MLEILDNKFLIIDSEETINILKTLEKDNTAKIIYFNPDEYKFNIKHNIFIAIDCNLIKNKGDIKKLIKCFDKLHKKSSTLQIGVVYNHKNILAGFFNTDNIDKKTFEDIIKCIIATTLTSKKEKYGYIYDEVCKYLDDDFKQNNYCDFKDDVCVAKRGLPKEKTVTMGCCHRFKPNIYWGKLQLCEYLKDKQCSAQCITCKLFTCNHINIKYNINDIILIDTFFNKVQKFIIRSSFFTPKRKIIKKLLLFAW